MDLSTNMISIAQEKANEINDPRVCVCFYFLFVVPSALITTRCLLLTVCEDRLACLLQVQFEVCDATKCKYAAEAFDVIYSRDTILHISDKRGLFAKFLVSIFTLWLTCSV